MPTTSEDANGFSVFHMMPSRLKMNVPLDFSERFLVLIVFTCVKFPVVFGCCASCAHTLSKVRLSSANTDEAVRSSKNAILTICLFISVSLQISSAMLEFFQPYQ